MPAGNGVPVVEHRARRRGALVPARRGVRVTGHRRRARWPRSWLVMSWRRAGVAADRDGLGHRPGVRVAGLREAALLVPEVLACQQSGNAGVVRSAVSSNGSATSLTPGAAGWTCGALTGRLTGPPITWLTVSTDTYWVCSQARNALKLAGLIEYWSQSLSQTWWTPIGSRRPGSRRSSPGSPGRQGPGVLERVRRPDRVPGRPAGSTRSPGTRSATVRALEILRQPRRVITALTHDIFSRRVGIRVPVREVGRRRSPAQQGIPESHASGVASSSGRGASDTDAAPYARRSRPALSMACRSGSVR